MGWKTLDTDVEVLNGPLKGRRGRAIRSMEGWNFTKYEVEFKGDNRVHILYHDDITLIK